MLRRMTYENSVYDLFVKFIEEDFVIFLVQLNCRLDQAKKIERKIE